jgi:hypothetical protein
MLQIYFRRGLCCEMKGEASSDRPLVDTIFSELVHGKSNQNRHSVVALNPTIGYRPTSHLNMGTVTNWD